MIDPSLINNLSDSASLLFGQQVLPELITITKQTYYEFAVWLLVIGFIAGIASTYGFYLMFRRTTENREKKELAERHPRFRDYINKTSMKDLELAAMKQYEKFLEEVPPRT